MNQLTMTGSGSYNDRQAKALAKAEGRRKKAALACAQKLEAAGDALNNYLAACSECEDATRSRGLDDSRVILVGNMGEYASYLRAVYDKANGFIQEP